jgi:hypothetical protein
MKINKTIIVLMLSLLSLQSYAGQDWKLKRDEDGIKVYTAATPNSAFKSIKVECTINSTPAQLIAFLLDIDKQQNWVYNSKNIRLLKKLAPNEYIFYSEVSVPWPCTNRDYIAHFVIRQVSPQLITLDSHAEPNYIPENDGIVRVKHSEAHWEVTTLDKDHLKMVYTVQFDPAGAIPAWLTNLFVTKGPYETFENLRRGVNDPAYKNAHIDFIK